MKPRDTLNLILLAAIWGGSFVLNRQVAPVLGPIWTVAARTWIAGSLLLFYFKIIGIDVQWKKYWKSYFAIGIVNTALPFVFYTFAALYLPASLSVILNSSTPLFGAVLSIAFLKERITLLRSLGLMSGIVGVVLLKDVPGLTISIYTSVSIFLCLAAAFCYAISGIVIRKLATEINPLVFAGASQITAGLVLLPFLPVAPPTGNLTMTTLALLLILSIVCSGVAYVLYFKLLSSVGPTKTFTVAYLMPAFGMLWGYLFLGETITGRMVFGCLLILLGVILVALQMRSQEKLVTDL